MRLIAIIFFLVTSRAFALDLDQKLTARILGVSDTKKTVLMNKGSEMGLVDGDHALFSLPSGAIARGVLSKSSPARSVWSVYRFYDQEKLEANVAVTVKIVSAVKLTEDESRALGILAEKYGKKEEAIPEDQTQATVEQKQVARDIRTTEQKIGAFTDMDFTTLEDNGLPKNLDPELEWGGLDGKRDADKVDARIDFSNLR
jgi:hypothetical protein